MDTHKSKIYYSFACLQKGKRIIGEDFSFVTEYINM